MPYFRIEITQTPQDMKKWLIFLLAFIGVATMIYVGVDQLAGNNHGTGMFFTFVGGMTVIGLVLDVANHLKTRRWM